MLTAVVITKLSIRPLKIASVVAAIFFSPLTEKFPAPGYDLRLETVPATSRPTPLTTR